MKQITLSLDQTLDDYVLNHELCTLAKISQNTHKFWKNTICAQFSGSRTVFLRRGTLPAKYAHFEAQCSSLKGLVLANAFCAFCGGLANSHLVASNGSKLGQILVIRKIGIFKFVDLNAFYERLGLPKDAKIYIEKCRFFSPTPFERRIKLTATLCLGYY